MAQSRARTRLDPEVRREQIAGAAARVFARHDPSEVSFEAVADEAGVSRSLVYAYFGDRGRLFAAAYEHEVDRLDDRVEAELRGIEDARERLERVVHEHLAFAFERPEVWRLIVSAGASRHEAVQEIIDRRVTRIAGQIGGATGMRILVRGVLGFLESAAVESIREHDDPEQVADLLLGLLWSGLDELDLAT